MKGIVVASHGKLAEGILDSAKLFFGEQDQLMALCISGGDDVDNFYGLMKSGVESVDTGDGVIIMCDILFGTPCNCAIKLLGELERNLDIITGVNLPMLLQSLTDRNSDIIDIEIICSQGIDGVKNVKKLLEEDIEED